MDTEVDHILDVMDVVTVMSLAAMDDNPDGEYTPSTSLTLAARSLVIALQFLAVISHSVNLKPVLAAGYERPGFVTAITRALLHRDKLEVLTATPDEENDKGADDIVSAALAILGSMAQTRTDVAIGMASSRELISVSTDTKAIACSERSCALTCRCTPSALPTLLAAIYMHYGSVDEAFAAYRHGYAAVLLTRFLAVYPPTRALLESQLPGLEWRDKLSGLLSSIVAFRELQGATHAKIRDIVATATAGESRDVVDVETPAMADDVVLADCVAFLEKSM